MVIATICNQKAAEEYKIAGDMKKYNENFINFQRNFHLDDSPVIIQKIEFPSFTLDTKNENEIIDYICKFTYIIPNEKNIRKEVENDILQNPLLLAGSHQQISHQGPSSNASNTVEEIKDDLIFERMILWIHYFEALLAKEIQKLENINKISVKGLMTFISNFSILEENNLALIRQGLEHHFNKDYIPSIHILISQIEASLRNLVKHHDMNILKEEHNTVMTKQLGGLLEISEIEKILGLDLTKYQDKIYRY